jgi:carbamoyl-phosphate synthase/aspartate carbamoyltransferase/dihydroorotase
MLTRLPGLIDVHVHLREPGGTHKESLASGTAAALAGGFTLVLDMPNTTPPTTDAPTLEAKQRLAEPVISCDVGFYVGAGHDNAARAAATASGAVGLKVYLDATYGPLRVNSLRALMEHMERWPRHRPVAFHAEGASILIALALGQLWERPVHLCHVSRRDEILLIRRAKERGQAVTCEVTPHHLFLTAADVPRLGAFGFMRPSLATPEDVAALWDNLDVIDCIATDHAPHTREEKLSPLPPPGVPGLETALPLMLTAVSEGRLSLERLVELMHRRPQEVFGLPEQPETWVEVDLRSRGILSDHGLVTRCGWTPFAGMAVWGRVVNVVLRGDRVVREGQVVARPGSGRVIFVQRNERS